MNRLTRHWELKLLALGFSVALWFFVMMSEKGDLVLSAPIEFDGVRPGLVLARERPESVDVQVHGLRGTLARLSPEQVKARVSLAGVNAGEATVHLSPDQVIVPVGLTVLRVNPSRIRVILVAAPPARPERGPRAPSS
jgi:YbbR-like protein